MRCPPIDEVEAEGQLDAERESGLAVDFFVLKISAVSAFVEDDGATPPPLLPPVLLEPSSRILVKPLIPLALSAGLG